MCAGGIRGCGGRFLPEEWAALADWQRELYWAVRKENYELVTSLGDGIWAGAEEKPWGAQKSLGGAAALPAPQGKVPNTCKDGGQSFSERGLLIVHVLRTHLGECNLPCGECGKILPGWEGWRRTREPTCGTGRWTRYAWSWPERSPSNATKCSNRIILLVEPPAERGRGSFPCPTAPSSSPTSTSCNAARCGTPGRRPSPAPSAARVCRGGSRSASTTGAPRPSSPAPAPGEPRAGAAVPLRAEWGALPPARLPDRPPPRPPPHPCAQCSQRFGSERAHAPDRPSAPGRPGPLTGWSTSTGSRSVREGLEAQGQVHGAPRLPPGWPALPPAAGTAPVPPPGAESWAPCLALPPLPRAVLGPAPRQPGPWRPHLQNRVNGAAPGGRARGLGGVCGIVWRRT
ncbi:unnamed protein product [Eretmochelys imbricata]